MAAQNNHLVIMAGGVGSRIWPVSTQQMPKQFVDIVGCGRSLLQLTMDRFKGLVPDENVWVVTSQHYRDIVHEQLPQIPLGNILLEPCRRNTAPCIAYASWRIKKQDPKANIVVSPSDHFVMDPVEFRRIAASCLDFVSVSDSIVTLGIQPSRPETGYGYIQVDRTASSPRNPSILRVDAFREKPDLAMATSYLAQGNYLWNAGIFVWNVSTIVNSLRIYAREISEIFENLLPFLGTEKEQEKVNASFPDCPSISIDYAVMEKAEEIFCFPADFGWSDMGTWGSLHDNTPSDAAGNTLIGPVEAHETKNCIVHTSQLKKVIVQGLEGYIVAEKDGQLLICKLSEEQRIKDFCGGN